MAAMVVGFYIRKSSLSQAFVANEFSLSVTTLQIKSIFNCDSYNIIILFPFPFINKTPELIKPNSLSKFKKLTILKYHILHVTIYPDRQSEIQYNLQSVEMCLCVPIFTFYLFIHIIFSYNLTYLG